MTPGSLSPRRVLIFRIGSLGDSVMALPAFHLIAQAFPGARRALLTNEIVTRKDTPASEILEGASLVHESLFFQARDRHWRDIWELRGKVRAWNPDVVIHLTQRRRFMTVLRDVAFFHFCGVRTVLGAPWSKDLREARAVEPDTLWESEAARLLRRLPELGTVALDAPENWDLRLGDAERRAIEPLLPARFSAMGFIVVVVGGKAEVKDWGQANWIALLGELSRRAPELGLAFVGSKDEERRCEELSRVWHGPTRNFCGRLGVRQSSEVIRRARLFIGQDCGPAHLAAAVGTPAVVVYSAREHPGVWFPMLGDNALFYHRTECFGCRLVEGCPFGKKCILSITPEEVLPSCLARLEAG